MKRSDTTIKRRDDRILALSDRPGRLFMQVQVTSKKVSKPKQLLAQAVHAVHYKEPHKTFNLTA